MNKNSLIKIYNNCQICSKESVGYHYGAYVCEACKKFFLRHTSGICRLYGTCQENAQCDLAINGRGKCQHCRFKKCKDIGMSISYKSSDYNLTVIPCQVCGAKSSGLHFGCITCEGCKGFFRRMIKFDGLLICFNNTKCQLNSNTRSACKSCRLERCIHIGMSRKGIRIGRHPNSLKYNCITLMKSEEKSALASQEKNSLHSSENSKSEISSEENYKTSLSDTENTFEDSNDLLIKEEVNIKTVESNEKEDVKEQLTAIREAAPENQTDKINVISLDINNSSSTIDPAVFHELQVHITQIINNLSPSSELLMQKEYKVNEGCKACIDSLSSAQTVWSAMMDHFLFHSQYIVKFAKLMPGFSKLNLMDKKEVIKDSMYPMILLELSQEYLEKNDEVFYNYFDFNSSDRIIILTYFPEFIDFSNHLVKCGSIKTLLNLNGVELTLMCGIIMFQNYHNLSRSIFGEAITMLYQEFLMIYFKTNLGLSLDEANRRKNICLQFISILNDMNHCHHKIITDFCANHHELQYPDLYIEIFANDHL